MPGRELGTYSARQALLGTGHLEHIMVKSGFFGVCACVGGRVLTGASGETPARVYLLLRSSL